jgi:hypothetical protein
VIVLVETLNDWTIDGKGRSNTAFTTLNTVMLAPMAKATVSTTVHVNSGDLRIMRSA